MSVAVSNASLPLSFETERLRLRQWRAEDVAPLARLHADPDMMRYMIGGAVSADESWSVIALMIGHWHLRGYGLWAVEEKASGAFLGRLGLWYPDGWPGLELSWFIDKTHWGKGYASEGARACRDMAFRALGPDEICSIIHPENAASRRVAEKLGEREARSIDVGGTDFLIYAMSRKDWQAL
ncbi:GNAT family N-acetyltransferase [Tepidicaulis sp.]|uniref:GNAT family N-acetyltransferase n=1 Tax=Tepidicaulis sp. TaxID=1920809 RepID=UPI003B5A79E0